MKTTLYFSLVLLISFSVLGQGTGHPGGGGPDTTVKEADLTCEVLAGETDELERKFTKSWNKNYTSSKDFFDLVDRIMIENLIHGLDTVEALKHKRPLNCDQDKMHLAKFALPQRPNYKAELKLLKEIERHWKEGRKNIIHSKKCSQYFSDRANKMDDVKNLIKLYEKQERD